ncbi:MAG: hypothetical protein FWG98_06475 [Candidatus Cloacimonetes bacterium]|nr:hypothetical protein [Candidatus Cloacimonadota bacterium]
MCVRFLKDYGDIEEVFYIGAETMFQKAVQKINELGLRSFLRQVQFITYHTV